MKEKFDILKRERRQQKRGKNEKNVTFIVFRIR